MTRRTLYSKSVSLVLSDGLHSHNWLMVDLCQHILNAESIGHGKLSLGRIKTLQNCPRAIHVCDITKAPELHVEVAGCLIDRTPAVLVREGERVVLQHSRVKRNVDAEMWRGSV
jgi:hypothetical protein